MATTEEETKTLASWSQDAETAFVTTWGDEYLRIGRGNLGKHNWEEVCRELNKRVKEGTFTVKQCKTKIDSLKKRYKDELGKKNSTGSVNSSWVHFNSLAAYLAASAKMKGIPGSCDSSAPAEPGGESSNSKENQVEMVQPAPVTIPPSHEDMTPPPAAVEVVSTPSPDVRSTLERGQRNEASMQQAGSSENGPKSPVTAFNDKFGKNTAVSGKGNSKRNRISETKSSPSGLAKEFGKFVKVFADLGQRGLDLEERLANNQMNQQRSLAERSETVNMELAQMKMQLMVEVAKMKEGIIAPGSRKRNRGGQNSEDHSVDEDNANNAE